MVLGVEGIIKFIDFAFTGNYIMRFFDEAMTYHFKVGLCTTTLVIIGKLFPTLATLTVILVKCTHLMFIVQCLFYV